jgi:hypothetical protein
MGTERPPGPVFDPDDPLFRPLSLEQVMAVTDRSERTIRRWIEGELLTGYRLPEDAHRRKVDLKSLVFNEAEVVDRESERSAAVRKNQDRIRKSGGYRGQKGGRPKKAT